MEQRKYYNGKSLFVAIGWEIYTEIRSKDLILVFFFKKSTISKVRRVFSSTEFKFHIYIYGKFIYSTCSNFFLLKFLEALLKIQIEIRKLMGESENYTIEKLFLLFFMKKT